MCEPIKKLGQNFLNDQTIAQIMVEQLNVTVGSDIIEIGSGLGIVTDVLSQSIREKGCMAFAVEIDSRFAPKLEEMFIADSSVHVINEDILDFLPKFTSTKVVHVIGSLPFYITSPIIHAIIKMNPQPASAVILIQKEVAQKVSASAPDASYMSSFVQAFYNVEYVAEVPAGKFNPIPEVDGAIVSLTKNTLSGEINTLEKITKFEGFLHRVFRSPRKMLNKVFTRDEMTKVGINPNQRPQEISAQKWVEAFNLLN